MYVWDEICNLWTDEKKNKYSGGLYVDRIIDGRMRERCAILSH